MSKSPAPPITAKGVPDRRFGGPGQPQTCAKANHKSVLVKRAKRIAADVRARNTPLVPDGLLEAMDSMKPARRQRQTRAGGRRKRGHATEGEQIIIKQMVAEHPGGDVPAYLVPPLAKTLRRPIEDVKLWIQQARQDFVEHANEYVNVHFKATVGALEAQDFETAGKLAQWGIEHIAYEGVRLVDPPAPAAPPPAPPLQIGIMVGGQHHPKDE